MSSIAKDKGRFDRLASVVSHQVSRAWFFTVCVLLVVVWAPTMVFMPIDSSQLIINTATTILTFLLVALLQNSESREFQAINAKLDALIELSEASNDLLRIEDKPQKDIEKARTVKKKTKK